MNYKVIICKWRSQENFIKLFPLIRWTLVAMVVQGFPGTNLIGQVLRQITQPLSKAIVKRVKKRPLLRKYILIQLGRFYYWCENMMKWEKVPIITKKRFVDDDRTMELGTKLLLEVTMQ